MYARQVDLRPAFVVKQKQLAREDKTPLRVVPGGLIHASKLLATSATRRIRTFGQSAPLNAQVWEQTLTTKKRYQSNRNLLYPMTPSRLLVNIYRRSWTSHSLLAKEISNLDLSPKKAEMLKASPKTILIRTIETIEESNPHLCQLSTKGTVDCKQVLSPQREVQLTTIYTFQRPWRSTTRLKNPKQFL